MKNFLKNKKFIVQLLLLILIFSNFSFSFAYWASSISSDQTNSLSSVQIGEWPYTNEVLTFQSDYAYVLSLIEETVEVSDKVAVEQALAAYGVLSEEAKTELTPEKDLLLSLLTEIIAFENSEYLDFETYPNESGLTGTIDILGRTWYGNDVYIAGDSAYDVWIDTYSLALRTGAYFESQDLFINGIDKIELYHGALNFNDGTSFAFIVEYELQSNPGVWVTLQDGGSDLIIDVISGDPLTFVEIDVSITEAVNIRFSPIISGTGNYINLDNIRIYENVVSSELEVTSFRTVYSDTLDLTVGSVEISDKVAVEAALSAYDLLSVEAKAELTVEKALLDDLLLEIETQEAIEAATQAVILAETTYLQTDLNAAQALVTALANSTEKTALQDRIDNVQVIINEITTFTNDYQTVLGLTVGTVQVSDKTAVEAAIAAYDLLSVEAQAELTDEHTLLLNLLAEINSQIPTATQVAEFRTNHATALALTVGTVQISDKAIVEAALTAYDILTVDAKAELTAEKALLDSLIIEINEQEATALVVIAETTYLQSDLDAAQVLVSALANGTVKTDLQDRLDIVQVTINTVTSFRADHAYVLGLTEETVEVSDKVAVEQALAAYGVLSEEAKTELTPEKDLLLSLLTEIIAFENSEYLDFETYPNESGLTGTIDILGRTWYGNDVYIAGDSAYDVWIDTYSLALRTGAYFESQDLFINGIDKIELYHGALNFNDGTSFAFIVEYELQSNPGVWVTLQDGGSDLIIDVISGDPLTFVEIDVSITEAVNIRFSPIISGTGNYINLDNIRIYENVVSSELEVTSFRTVYSDTLDLTVGSVEISDKVAVEAALSAYDLLSVEAKAELTVEKALLDDLLLEIETQEAIEAATQAVILAETTYLQTDLNAAQALVTALANSTEKTALQDRIDNVQVIINEITTFTNDYQTVLGLTVGTVQVSDKTAVEAAIAAYDLLSVEAQAELTDEHTLLLNLLAEINSQIPTATQVAEFRTNHATALALTVGTVQISDKAIVEAALTAYDILTVDAKAELTAEKALLDSLIIEINEQEATALVVIAETTYLQSDLDAAQVLVSALANGTVKTDLQDRLDIVQVIINNLAANQVDNQILAIPNSGEISLADESQIQAARSAYQALTTDQKLLVQYESILSDAEDELQELQTATDSVIVAELSNLQADVDSAQVLVTLLPNGSSKTALQNRLNAVQDIIDVNQAESLLIDYFSNNFVIVQRLNSNSIKETEFLADANSVVSGLGVVITITNTNRIDRNNTIYTIDIVKNDAIVSIDISVNFVRG